MTKPPWSMRQSPELVEEFFVLRKGIPDGLLNSLLSSAESFYSYSGDARAERTEHLARRVGRDLPQHWETLLRLFAQDHPLLLDALDHMLMFPDHDERRHQLNVSRLKQYFDDARSVYDVRQVDRDEYEIQYRQPPELTRLVENALSANTRAAEHLKRAWSNAFSRTGSPNDACFEATKAVEAVARIVILPKNPKATLGTIVAAMEAKTSKWATDFESAEIADIESVIAMMQMVWKGHLRHGNPDEPLDVSAERAAMIVHLAVVLVHWFDSGRIRAAS